MFFNSYVNFRRCVSTERNLLGEIGKGHIIAFNILNIGRYKLGVGTVGSAKRAVEISAQYANQRQQFKQPIARFPLIQEKLANMAAKHMQLKALYIVQ